MKCDNCMHYSFDPFTRKSDCKCKLDPRVPEIMYENTNCCLYKKRKENDEDERCYRCRGIHKIMLKTKIDDKPIRLCGNCYRDFLLFLDGYVVNPLVKYEDKREMSE